MKSPHVFTFWLAKVDNLDALDDGAVLLEPGQEGLDVTFSGAEQLPVEIVRLQLADLERKIYIFIYVLATGKTVAAQCCICLLADKY